MTNDFEPGKVHLCYLHGTDVAAAFHRSMLDLIRWDIQHEQRLVDGGGIVSAYSGSGHIEDGRNDLAKYFLDQAKAEWMFMVDADMGFDANALDMLMSVANPTQFPVIGGLCFTQTAVGTGAAHVRRFRMDPTIYLYRHGGLHQPVWDYPKDSMVQCDTTGTAFLLIHRSALQRIRDEHGDRWFTRMDIDGKRIGEDFSFCRRLAGVGIPVHVHTAVKTSHDKHVNLDEALYDQSNQPPRFAIAGTGRSGSGFISQVLTAAGVKCGHEEWWNPWMHRIPGLIGDSSWLASLDFEDFEGIVYHQVRHPLSVVSSMVHELFTRRIGPYYEIRIQEMELSGDDVLDAMRCYLAWYDAAANGNPTRTWRVEDVDADLIVQLGKDLGIEVTEQQARTALERVPNNYNYHGDKKTLAFAELPDGPERERIAAIAAEHGYEL